MSVSWRCDCRFLLSNGATSLNFEQVETLWTECVCNNITAAERETFFEWFHKCIADDTRPGASMTPFYDDVLDKVRRGCVSVCPRACFSCTVEHVWRTRQW